MNNKQNVIRTLSTLLIVLLFFGCSKSTLVTSWEKSAHNAYQMKKVLVIAVFKDPITQSIYENSFVNLLKKSGVEAVAGNKYKLSGPDKPSKQAIDSVLEKSGATSLLITHVLSISTQTYHDPPMEDYVVYGGYWDSYYGYHSYVYHQIWAAETTTQQRYERMEVTLFDAASNAPVWSARSESVNLEDRLRRDDEELERLFIANLRKRNLLP